MSHTLHSLDDKLDIYSLSGLKRLLEDTPGAPDLFFYGEDLYAWDPVFDTNPFSDPREVAKAEELHRLGTPYVSRSQAKEWGLFLDREFNYFSPSTCRRFAASLMAFSKILDMPQEDRDYSGIDEAIDFFKYCARTQGASASY